jgi:segregation and condensation protein A
VDVFRRDFRPLDTTLPFDDAIGVASGDGEALVVDVDGFEGPLDLLLELARRQKVDLARISILALADQYLAFVEEAGAKRLELAADYLVMAAWLAYLKSRLLLPKDSRTADGPSAEDLASRLAERLRALETIRAAARELMKRPMLGEDVFARGAPEPLAIDRRPAFEASIHDLLTAYARQRQKHAQARVVIQKRFVWSLADAREILARLVGAMDDWTPVDAFLIRHAIAPDQRRSLRASGFAAMLEMAREGGLELRQHGTFEPIYLRRKAAAATGAA